ncbi:MAG: flagellar hook-length control protein FliK [Deltaproteobacteria bacterium]|nr:flagellar hook-length control protein FliK [Deltaproteobacteria bacterium]
MKIDGVAQIQNTLTFLSRSGEGFRLKIGDVVRAEVLSLQDDGNVSIRITMESGKTGVVTARSEVPLDPGENILLKVVGGEREIALRFLGVLGEEASGTGSPAGLAEEYRGLASELAASRLTSAGIRDARETLRLLPPDVKDAVRGFGVIEESAPEIAGLDGPVLKDAVEGSGILLETKLKISAGEESIGTGTGLAAAMEEGGPAAGPDLKEALLRLREALREHGAADAAKAPGGGPGRAHVEADRLLATIESFQLASAAHGVLCAPLHLAWNGLVDGEMLFRKGSRGKGESYTCELNLDLRPLGRMSVSVTMYDRAFFVSFAPESEETRSLLASLAEEVGKRFREADLDLKAVSVHRKKSVTFGVPARDGVDLEV